MSVASYLCSSMLTCTHSNDSTHSSRYKLDTRTKGGWWKWKPEYVDALSDHLDMMIVGGYYSDASRGTTIKRMGAANGFTQFMMAVPTKFAADGKTPTEWASMSRVGTGYSLQKLVDLNNLLEKKWKKTGKGKRIK